MNQRQSHIPAILVILLTVIVSSLTFFYLALPDKIPDGGIVQMMIGNLFAGWMLALNFWIGSNRKDQPADIQKENQDAKSKNIV